jgi:urease accessory protein
MTVVEVKKPVSDLGPEERAFRRDTITLTWEERRQGHGKRKSDSGVEFAISLPAGAILKQDDCLVLSADRTVVVVHEAKERVYVIRPKTPQDWAYYAYHVGNRHQPVMIGETELIFPETPAVRSLLEQLHADYSSDARAFNAAVVGHSHSHE